MQEVLREVAHSLREDEDFAKVIIEEPEVTGVEMLAADSVTLRVMVKTAPLEQWKVARELRHRLKDAFDAEGIEIPFPQRSLWLRTSPESVPTPVTDAPDAGAPAPAPAPPASSRRDAPAPPGEVEAMRDDTGSLQRPTS